MLTRSAGRKLVSLTALAALALAPVPALARDHAVAGDDGDFVSKLSDPQRQEAMGRMMAAMLGAMLSIKADPLARAAERMGDHRTARRIRPGTTLGDLAGPEARRLPGEVRRQVPAMMGAMGELAGMMKDMAPMLETMGEELGKDFDEQMDEAGPTG